MLSYQCSRYMQQEFDTMNDENPDQINLTNKAYKVRLYPNSSQKTLINKTVGCCRFVYNHALDEHENIYEKFKNDKEALKKYKYQTVKQMREQHQFLKEVPAICLNSSLRNLSTAYQNFYKGLKNGTEVGLPQFKSRNKSRSSYTEFVNSITKGKETSSIRINKNKIHLLKLGWVSFRGLSSSFHGTICSCTICREKSGKYLASILTEQEQQTKIRTGNGIIGLNLGIRYYAVSSDGNYYDSLNAYFNEIDRKIKRLHRRFNRKEKDSKNREKARCQLAKAYEYKKNYIDKFHWCLANKLCSENKIIILDTFSIKRMMGNHYLAREIQNASWYTFKTKLTQKAKEYGTQIINADNFFSSTQKCFKCGTVKTDGDKLSPDDTLFKCDCGYSNDRDFNAALNLRSLDNDGAVLDLSPEIKHWRFDGTSFILV